jgi:hypothetical protein
MSNSIPKFNYLPEPEGGLARLAPGSLRGPCNGFSGHNLSSAAKPRRVALITLHNKMQSSNSEFRHFGNFAAMKTIAPTRDLQPRITQARRGVRARTRALWYG